MAKKEKVEVSDVVQFQLDAIAAVKKGLDIAIKSLENCKDNEDPELVIKLVHCVAQTSAALSNLIKGLGKAHVEGWLQRAQSVVGEQQKIA